MSSASPVSPAERIPLLDILRGAALFGILLVNFNEDYFATPVAAVDRAARVLIEFFFAGSFYPLFSFLFGLGFALQVERWQARGAPVGRFYLRRLGALLGFGLAHAVLLWHGDILRHYAILGFPLLLVRRLGTRTLLVGAALCLLVAVKFDVVTSLVRLSPAVAIWTTLDHGPGPGERALLGPIEREVIRNGTYQQLVRVRARIVWLQERSLPLDPIVPQIFAMFLLGLLAGRRGVLVRFTVRPLHLGRVMWGALVVGLLGNFVSVLGPVLEASGIHLIPRRVLDFAGVFQLVGDAALSLSYGAVITILVSQWESRGHWLAPLGLVGRMGLTNYLLQSAVMLVLMCGFGFGLAYKLHLASSIPLKMGIFAGQIGLSGWWLKRFRMGPAEWLWRAVTYGSMPRLLISTSR